MKSPLALLLAFATFPFVVNAQRTRSLEALATTMVGSYTSAAQATEDTSYFNIELEMVRIWPKRKDGAWFYVEQAASNEQGEAVPSTCVPCAGVERQHLHQ